MYNQQQRRRPKITGIKKDYNEIRKYYNEVHDPCADRCVCSHNHDYICDDCENGVCDHHDYEIDYIGFIQTKCIRFHNILEKLIENKLDPYLNEKKVRVRQKFNF